jgi:CheY-like chemotaxis protein
MPRVLYIEDEPYLVKTLPAVLENRDKTLQIVRFTDIVQALERLREEEFDLVLLDISMPPTEDMDFDQVEQGRLTGIAVAQRIKEMKPDMPIAALTVVSDLAMQRKMRDVGIGEIINKPAEIDAIVQVILRNSSSSDK